MWPIWKENLAEKQASPYTSKGIQIILINKTKAPRKTKIELIQSTSRQRVGGMEAPGQGEGKNVH